MIIDSFLNDNYINVAHLHLLIRNRMSLKKSFLKKIIPSLYFLSLISATEASLQPATEDDPIIPSKAPLEVLVASEVHALVKITVPSDDSEKEEPYHWDEDRHNTTLEDWGLNDPEPIMWSPFTLSEENFDEMLYLDTGWGIIFEIQNAIDVDQLPI